MKITCGNCSRSFDVDDQRVSNIAAARCVCGKRILLNPKRNTGSHQRLGKYLLLRRIAVGGMGEIFYGKSSGIEGFEKEVAIKRMLPHLSADRDFIQMMVKEAKTTNLLVHPNIVQIYDLDKEGDEYYIAMEYVPGSTVSGILEQTRKANAMLPVQVPVHVVSQVLRGLSYAHNVPGPDGRRITILHRDITPQNILVTRRAFVKITDFGIAKAVNEISTTSPGMIKGKLGYIGPEQLEGKEPDHRVDIFCAGILLWEMLAVRRLFRGATEIDTFRLIAECRIPPLSEFRSDVPPALEAVLRQALARDRDARFGRAEEFNAALNQAIAPSTTDDYAAQTEVFLGQHPEYFANVIETSQAAESDSDNATRSVDINGAGAAAGKDVDTGELMPVTTYTMSMPSPDPAATPASAIHSPPTTAQTMSPVAAWKGRLGVGLLVIALLATGSFIALNRQVLGLTQPPVAPPPPTSPESSLPVLSNDEVQLAVDAERDPLTTCYKDVPEARRPSSLIATLLIASTGGVGAVTLDPQLQPFEKTRTCLENVLRGLHLRPHGQPRFEAKVTLPAPPKPTLADKTAREDRERERRPLTGGEIQTTVQRYQEDIARCLGLLKGSGFSSKIVQAKVTIAASGRVSNVLFTPRLEHAGADSCLQRSLRNMHFRKHPKDMTVTIPLKIEVL